MGSNNESSPGRKGLCAWGLTHRMKFERMENKLFKVTTVYNMRIKLPKYLQALLRARVVKESEMRVHANGLKARVMNYMDTTGEVSARVLDLNYLVPQPEITIQVRIENDIYNKERIAGILRKFREYINQFLDIYRDILGDKIRETAERGRQFDNDGQPTSTFLNYRICVLNKGQETQTECIRYIRHP